MKKYKNCDLYLFGVNVKFIVLKIKLSKVFPSNKVCLIIFSSQLPSLSGTLFCEKFEMKNHIKFQKTILFPMLDRTMCTVYQLNT